MSGDDLIGIGGFAVLAGLSVPALRHYDDVGLLAPAAVDPRTGYRRYRLEQVRVGRLIGALRAVDLPIESVRRVLDGDAASTRAALSQHREQLAERGRELAGWLAQLDDYIENGVHVSHATGSRICEINLGVDDLDRGPQVLRSRVRGGVLGRAPR